MTIYKDWDAHIGDSTEYGWGFEIGAILAEAEMMTELQDSVDKISDIVTAFASERMTEDDDPVDPGMVYAIVDCIVHLFDQYQPVVARMHELKSGHMRLISQCASPRDVHVEKIDDEQHLVEGGLWDLENLPD
jgi:hypothetical protein